MIKNILFDFDGVILDSMPIRDFGFKEIFKDFDKDIVEKLLQYHRQNGGLSRYVKIRYFYEELLVQEISENRIQELAEEFSKIMKKELTNKQYIIDETYEFIKNNTTKYNLHIVSGSDEKELQYLCKELGLEKYFISINGSPTPKNEIVKKVLREYNYMLNETILIGDSINDFEAAKINNIDFYGFNNENLINCSKTYIDKFENILFLDYGIGENSISKENRTFCNIKENEGKVDYLLFFDSRALTINQNEYDETYLIKMLEIFNKCFKSYIAVSRPKNITIFATLLNFLENNKDIKFKNLITNVGFVDFTPKKNEFIEDMLLQIKYLHNEEIKIEKLSNYDMQNGNDFLYSLLYKQEYKNFIRNTIDSYKFNKTFFMNTPEISEMIKIDRNRPIEFFTKILVSNQLIDEISKLSHLINLRKLFKDEERQYTYDAVHYTLEGHQCIIDKIMSTNEF
ncbi:MAG: HAD-IA family hydrolase [Candidatus Marinarcus sp.]|uniref:HAD-IA family hydrolase n=1 Tax=Candidatus Marinarcus sp. TaxID=3100987 RepID=UPI003AFFD50D